VNTLISEDERSVAVIVNVIPGLGESGGGATDELPLGDEFAEDVASESAPSAKVISSEELAQVMQVMLALQEEFESVDFEIHLTGDQQMTYALTQVMSSEVQKFLGITMLIIAGALFLFFRRISGVLLPMLVVFLPLNTTIGLMGWVGLPMTLSTQNLPTFLFAVCIGDAVHILTIFYQQLDEGASRDEAIVYALRHSGLAVLMTSVTTAGALGTFAFSDLMPIAGLGLAAPVGVMLAFVYSVVLLPALLAVLPIRAKCGGASRGDEASLLNRALVGLGDFCTGRAWLVVGIWSVLIAVSLYGASQVRMSHDSMKWFPEGHPTRVAAEPANREMKGSMPLESIIDSGRENGLLEPEVLRRIEEVEAFTKSLRTDYVQASQTVSVVEILKEIHKALNENDPAFYALPQDRALIAQELLLFEASGSDDLEEMVDGSYRYARIHVPLPFVDGLLYGPYTAALEEGAREILGDLASLEASGLIVLYMRSTEIMLRTTVESYVLALIMIAPLMMLLIGDFRLGLISLIPNIAPIIIGMGFIYYSSATFDMFSMTIGTIIIGVAVDDTIHFMHSFRRYYRGGDAAVVAVRKTMRSTGRALLVTSVALCAGFYVQMLSEMVSVKNYGMVTGFAIVAALFADLTLSPALVVLATRFAEKRVAVVPSPAAEV